MAMFQEEYLYDRAADYIVCKLGEI